MINKILIIIFLILNFFHGVFASGFIPILNEVLGEKSAFAFALYFFGILLGQLAIYKYSILSKSRNSYPFYEVLFGLSLIFMARYNGENPLMIGRFLEGLAAGLATPVLFANVVNIEAFGAPGKRLALFNSFMAIGFVIGPFLVAGLMKIMSYQNCLLYFGLLFILIPAVLFFTSLPKIAEEDNENISLKKLFSAGDLFEKFNTLLIAKCFYGFLLAFTTAHLMSYFKNWNIEQVMFVFVMMFIIGQILTVKTVSVFPKQHLEVYLPLLKAMVLIIFFFTGNHYMMFIAALFHSALAFIGYMNFGLNAGSGREFAFYNSLSDPAIILGSLFATFGINGIWGLVIIAPLPLINFLRSPANQVRSEKLFPFVGPFTFYKIIKKHESPLKTVFENKILDVGEGLRPSLSFDLFDDHSNPHAKKIKFLSTGDFGPDPELVSLSEEMTEFIREHDFRLINLEGVQVSENNQAKIITHDISDKQFKQIISPFYPTLVRAGLAPAPKEGEPNFNLINFVNNHVLDLGNESYNKTLTKIKDIGDVDFINSNLLIKNHNNLKIGFFSITFGINFPWRQHPDIISLKPEDFLNNIAKRLKFINKIHKFKQEVDLLVMSYHWGYESEYLPSDIQNQCFDIFKKEGVDILYGHHSHIVQPYKISEDRKALCIYSCGNFISDMSLKVYQQGVLYSVEIEEVNNIFQVSKVEPRFFEANNGIISFIDKNEVDVFLNWQKIKR